MRMIRTLSRHEQLNFLLTNRVPRQLLTRLMRWYSRINSPLLTKISIAMWRWFADDLDLSEAKKSHFESLHDCFIRELKPAARPIDLCPNYIVSPCDAIIGASGHIDNGTLFQAKGFPYELKDLIPNTSLQDRYRDGLFVTLRLKSSMYHRFHAPVDCELKRLTYISGDTWNVNPIALKRIEQLFCKNERAVLDLELTQADLPGSIAMVPVAAILVASMKFHCLPEPLDIRYQGPNSMACHQRYQRGDEMGYFQHGSTIIMLASHHYRLSERVEVGERINMGEPLLKVAQS